MAGSFLSPTGEDLQTIYVDDYGLIDQYAATGSLWLWGHNSYGQLGTSNTTHRSSPVQTVSAGTNWKQVACGRVITAAIKTDGTLWSWGTNTSGELGNNATTSRSSPVQTVSAGTNWKLVSVGQAHTAAIKTDGSLWSWGRASYGQLGNNATTSRSSPVQTVSAGTNWKLVAAGNYHTAAIKTDGTLWSWGHNFYGQLGDNSYTHRSSPIQTIAGGTNWEQVSCGGGTTAAIKTDGTLWLWGAGSFGQLGNNNTTSDQLSPVQTVSGGTNWKSVSCGYRHTAAIKTDGTLWTWGQNNYGQLGNGTVFGASSPVQTVAAGTTWKLVEGGQYHTAAIKTDGTLWLWGSNTYWQLGDNTVTNKSSPIQTVAGGTNWKLVSAGMYHTAAVYFYDTGDLYPDA